MNPREPPRLDWLRVLSAVACVVTALAAGIKGHIVSATARHEGPGVRPVRGAGLGYTWGFGDVVEFWCGNGFPTSDGVRDDSAR